MSAEPTFSLSGDWLLRAKTPLVYVWRRGDAVLYVGVSRYGIARPLSHSHGRLTTAALRPSDELACYGCKTAREAIQLEQALIRALKPTLNKSTTPALDHSDPNAFGGLKASLRETDRLLEVAEQQIGVLKDGLRAIADGCCTLPVQRAVETLAALEALEDAELERVHVALSSPRRPSASEIAAGHGLRYQRQEPPTP